MLKLEAKLPVFPVDCGPSSGLLLLMFVLSTPVLKMT